MRATVLHPNGSTTETGQRKSEAGQAKNLSSGDVMTMASTQKLTGAAQALFVSTLQPSDHPAAQQVQDAIITSLRTYRDASGCAAKMAAAFGEYPEQAADRMRWALGLTAA
jgi:hypothetical protein